MILGLLCPVYIAKLEFKSKEELQLMPQTEEEHLIGLEEENESLEGQPTDPHRNTDPDAEVSIFNLKMIPILFIIKFLVIFLVLIFLSSFQKISISSLLIILNRILKETQILFPIVLLYKSSFLKILLIYALLMDHLPKQEHYK